MGNKGNMGNIRQGSCPEIGLHNEVLISKPKTGQI